MTYAQIDDRFDEHPKYAAADFDIDHFGLLSCAITYCNRHLTDGVMPESAVRKFGRGNARRNLVAAQFIVDAGVWRRVPGGFEVVGFLDHNRSKVEVLARRDELHEKRSAAGRIGGVRSGMARAVPAKNEANEEAKAKHGSKQNEANEEAKRKQNEALSSPAPLLSETDPETNPDTSGAGAPSGLVLLPSEPAEPKDPADEVYEHWLSARKRHNPRTQRIEISPKDRKALAAKLKSGASVDDLKLACEGLFLSPHHRGENDRSTPYLAFEYVLRDRNFDSFVELGRKARARRDSAPAEAWKPSGDPVTQEEYAAAVEGLQDALAPDYGPLQGSR